MPELPDVEAQRRFAHAHAVGRTVTSVACPDPQILRTTTPQGLGRALSHATILSVERRGKWLWLMTDAVSDVLVHFGMTGAFHWHPSTGAACANDLVQLALGGEVFAYNASRKLGGVWLVRGARESREITGELGVDGLEADEDVFRSAFAGSRAGLKAALMDQSRVAGIGNLIADELCWHVRLHPATPCEDLAEGRWADLAEALARILAVGVEVGQVPAGDGWLTGAREAEDPRCPRCGASLASGTIAGRSTRWCPAEQPDPR